MKKKGFILYFVIIIVIMGIGSMNKILTYPSMLASVILAIMLGRAFVNKPNVDMCEGIILLLMFQNFSIGLGAHYLGNTDSSLKFITQIPFLTIFTIWFIITLHDLKRKNEDKASKFFGVLLICILFSCIINRGTVLAILTNLRNMTVFYMAYVIGKKGIRSEIELGKFINFLIKIASIFLVFGVVLLITGYEGYSLIGIKEVYIAKGVSNVRDSLDGRFHTTLISKQYTRMGSLLYEPVNLAYFYAAVSILTIFGRWTKNKFKKVFFSLVSIIGLILTFGKGGYMIFGIAISAYYLGIFIKAFLGKINSKLAFKITTIFCVISVTVFCIYYYKNIGAAVSPHFWGIERTWKSVVKQPWGYGLGTGGNAAQTFNSSNGDWLETGGETALMSFMYQIGIQGILALILTMLNMTNIRKKQFYRKEDKDIGRLIGIFNYIPIVLIGVSLLQDNTFTPQCIVVYMFVIGSLKNMTQNSNKIQQKNYTKLLPTNQ